jgi:hypothetical protein
MAHPSACTTWAPQSGQNSINLTSSQIFANTITETVEITCSWAEITLTKAKKESFWLSRELSLPYLDIKNSFA